MNYSNLLKWLYIILLNQLVLEYMIQADGWPPPLICRSTFKRSLSDGNILSESNSPIENASVDKHETNKQMCPDKIQGSSKVHSESTPEILSCESEASYTTRSAFTIYRKDLLLQNIVVLLCKLQLDFRVLVFWSTKPRIFDSKYVVYMFFFRKPLLISD